MSVVGGAYGRQIPLTNKLSYIHFRKPNADGSNVFLLKDGHMYKSFYIEASHDDLSNILRAVIQADTERSRNSRVSGGSRTWISKALEKGHPGRFSTKASRAGLSVQDFACKVLRSKAYDLATRREAQMFVNMNRKRRC